MRPKGIRAITFVIGIAAVLAACGSGAAPQLSDRPAASAPTTSSPAPVASPTEAPSAAAASELEGTWATAVTTCEQQKAALAKAGFTSEDLAAAAWDPETCGENMHGRQFTIRFAGDSLVAYQDDVLGWEGEFRVTGPDTFEAGDTGGDFSYEYAIDGDALTIDVVHDDVPGVLPAELIAERLAMTVILETAPFARVTATSVLPYAIRLPDGWVTSSERADTFA